MYGEQLAVVAFYGGAQNAQVGQMYRTLLIRSQGSTIITLARKTLGNLKDLLVSAQPAVHNRNRPCYRPNGSFEQYPEGLSIQDEDMDVTRHAR